MKSLLALCAVALCSLSAWAQKDYDYTDYRPIVGQGRWIQPKHYVADYFVDAIGFDPMVPVGSLEAYINLNYRDSKPEDAAHQVQLYGNVRGPFINGFRGLMTTTPAGNLFQRATVLLKQDSPEDPKLVDFGSNNLVIEWTNGGRRTESIPYEKLSAELLRKYPFLREAIETHIQMMDITKPDCYWRQAYRLQRAGHFMMKKILAQRTDFTAEQRKRIDEWLAYHEKNYPHGEDSREDELNYVAGFVRGNMANEAGTNPLDGDYNRIHYPFQSALGKVELLKAALLLAAAPGAVIVSADDIARELRAKLIMEDYIKRHGSIVRRESPIEWWNDQPWKTAAAFTLTETCGSALESAKRRIRGIIDLF